MVAEAVYDRGIPAAEEKRDDAQATLPPAPPTDKSGTLQLDPTLVEPDNHYDAVVCYALFQETPDDVCEDILREMNRIMAPGGDIIISDPPPLRALTPYAAVLSDWETENREEPYFGASTRRSLPRILSAIGFANAEESALEDGTYPWVTRANKPE